jgi:hypothetical protein
MTWIIKDCGGRYRTTNWGSGHVWSTLQSDARRYHRLDEALEAAEDEWVDCRVVRLVSRAESRRVSREDRLRALGYEMPSDEQRRENLAANVAIIQRRTP